MVSDLTRNRWPDIAAPWGRQRACFRLLVAAGCRQAGLGPKTYSSVGGHSDFRDGHIKQWEKHEAEFISKISLLSEMYTRLIGLYVSKMDTLSAAVGHMPGRPFRA